MSSENGKMHTPATTTIKREQSGINNVQLTNGVTKLSSLTPARDLTLGGRGGGVSKKVFQPNLNVVRNRNANVKTSKDTTRSGRAGRGRGERGSTRGAGSPRSAGRGGANSTLIQTSGVFSEGAGAVNIRKTSYESGYSHSRHDDVPASALRKPTIIKNEQKIDLIEEAAQIRDVLGDSDEDDFLDEKTDLALIPITLSEGKTRYVKNEIKSEMPDAVDMPIETNDDSVAIAQHLQTMHVQQQEQCALAAPKRYPENVNAFLELTQPQIFLMQLPDTLPCIDDEDGEKDIKLYPASLSDAANTSSSTSMPADSAPVRSNMLKKMEEGKIGKLIRYKSGKIKLVLGESYFDLEMGMETGFLQELMSISTNRQERSGNMINLGPIQAKLNATPDWEYLFQQHQQSQPTQDNRT